VGIFCENKERAIEARLIDVNRSIPSHKFVRMARQLSLRKSKGMLLPRVENTTTTTSFKMKLLKLRAFHSFPNLRTAVQKRPISSLMLQCYWCWLG